MKPFACLVVLLYLQGLSAAELPKLSASDQAYFAMMDRLSRPNQWEYRVTEDGTVFRVTPTPATEGPDIDFVRTSRLESLARGGDPSRNRRFVFASNPATKAQAGRPHDPTEKPPAGTPEKDKVEAKTPDKENEKAKDADNQASGKTEQKQQNDPKDPDWPPKEVAPADNQDWAPTEEEFNKIHDLCVEAKNSGDNQKKYEASRLARSMIARVVSPGLKLPTTEWAKRYEALRKIEKAAEETGYSYAASSSACRALAEDIATEEKHPAMFGKLKWMFENQRKYAIEKGQIRVAVYRYIENHPDAFKDAAAKRLFCDQLMKGGVNEPGLKELRDSYK